MEELTNIADRIDNIFEDLRTNIGDNIGIGVPSIDITMNISAGMSIREKLRSISIPVGNILGEIYEPIRAAIYH